MSQSENGGSERRASLRFLFSPVQHAKPPPSTTNKIILDYLLYLSTQSRLKQAQVELQELAAPLEKKDTDAIQIRKKRWLATSNKAEQDKNAVEAIVAGILSSHRHKRPSFQVDNDFEQRLHLCQLTNMLFGRLDTTHKRQPVLPASSRRVQQRRSHYSHRHANSIHDVPGNPLEQNDVWSVPITPHYCRRHRTQRCLTCCQETLDHDLPPGLMECIPTFVKTSADLLRRTLETPEEDDKKRPLIFAGQKVMGGGMPSRWYDLFLDVLTQAAIESYLCDMQSSPESIIEIFSYGEVEDEDDNSPVSLAASASAASPSTSTSRPVPGSSLDDDDDDQDQDPEDDDHEWSINAADHHLLFPKTRTMFLFRTQVREREKEFLTIDKDTSLQQHFVNLSKRYPSAAFEKSISEFLQMIHNTMHVPELDKNEAHQDQVSVSSNDSIDTEPTVTSSTPNIHTVYKYPGDGALLMPEIPDEDDQLQEPRGTKRRASLSVVKEDSAKKHAA
ncbi:hypothetical protein DM01DRAFT_1339506 [Hesseltinella vesiculosa]|uniref:Uncharacterized protein n=1 Tax=Hesseltinella vesiculosa TaxID=101127 RepID=A0A1X2G6P8_9FUNG|nr:hypothetical protein DM01DRAFT_1339506 [Hesseltinella vesiculosa]